MALVACAGVKLRHLRLRDQEEEGDQTADDVQPVEAGGQVEPRCRTARTTACLVLGDQGVVLVPLAEDEDQPEHEAEQVPAAQCEDVAAFRGETRPTDR